MSGRELVLIVCSILFVFCIGAVIYTRRRKANPSTTAVWGAIAALVALYLIFYGAILPAIR